MFTLPHNTVVYLYKEAIDMRLGMFRLQGVIAQQLSQSMARGCFFLFINKPHTLLKAVWFDGSGSAKGLNKANSVGHKRRRKAMKNGCKSNHLRSH